MNNRDDYELLDSGNGRKLERFGPYILNRPSSQAVWEQQLSHEEWKKADALFLREDDTKWSFRHAENPKSWQMRTTGLIFKISPTDFGHLGLFPEQKDSWEWIQKIIHRHNQNKELHVLNLFAYSGGSTLAAAKAGAHVCHLDASKGMVAWARENAVLNQLEQAPIRWIVDDVNKFLQREIRRGKKYDGIILDPPSFGRGSQGEVFKIEEQIHQLLHNCKSLLTYDPLFVLFSCHTPGFTPVAMHHLMTQMMKGFSGKIEAGEMLLKGSENVFTLSSGTYSRWCNGLI